MVCENPRYIYVRKKFPIHINSEEELHKYNKPSLHYKKGWQQIQVPCGECACCRVEKANDWATRITNEAETWNCKGIFLTLSYNNKHLPFNNEKLTTLRQKDIQDFKKRLRKFIKKHNQAIGYWTNPYNGKLEKPIRTFECGEYGYNGTRAAIGGNPHYHMIIFNWIPDDLEFSHISKKSGFPIYKSKTIHKLWGMGDCPIGYVSYESASYVARYTMKKNGLAKVKRIYFDKEVIDEKTGEIKLKKSFKKQKGIQEPEFITMSKGIGRTYFIQNMEKIKENKCIIIKSAKDVKMRKIPRYYKKVWQSLDWLDFERYKYNYKKEIDTYLIKEMNKYNLPEEWNEEKKLSWINTKKIENWKAKKDRLARREVA